MKLSDPLILAALISVVGTLIGCVISAFLAWYFTRRKQGSEVSKNDADASAAVAASAKLLIDPLNAQINTLTSQIASMQASREADRLILETMRLELLNKDGQLQELRGGIDVLIGQFKQLGVTPHWEPQH